MLTTSIQKIVEKLKWENSYIPLSVWIQILYVVSMLIKSLPIHEILFNGVTEKNKLNLAIIYTHSVIRVSCLIWGRIVKFPDNPRLGRYECNGKNGMVWGEWHERKEIGQVSRKEESSWGGCIWGGCIWGWGCILYRVAVYPQPWGWGENPRKGYSQI